MPPPARRAYLAAALLAGAALVTVAAPARAAAVPLATAAVPPATAAVPAAGLPAEAVPAAAPAPAPGVTRHGGADRYAVAAAISRGTFAAGAKVVYVATGLNFPDALSGAAVAGRSGSPLLLVPGTSIPAVVAAELTRLGPERIVVLGGAASVTDSVLSQLGQYARGSVTRIGGAHRYAVSAALSAATYPAGVPVVYVATGETFPDALAGAPVAARDGAPVLIVPGTFVPGATDAELTRLRPRRIVVLGGPGSVSEAVLTALQGYTTGPVERIWAADRYGVAVEIAARSFSWAPPTVYVAKGEDFADALAGAPAAALHRASLLLVPSTATTLPRSVDAELRRTRPGSVVILGGTGSVSPQLAQRLSDRLGPRTGAFNGGPLTPPRGFNTWERFQCTAEMNEQTIRATADAFVARGLREAGWTYVDLDECWSLPERGPSGELQVDPARFPSGIAALAAYVHERGLKFGIYGSAGTLTCRQRPGSHGHFAADFEQFAAWGVDLVKLDYCGIPTVPELTAAQVAKDAYLSASAAIAAASRPMVLAASAPAYFAGSPDFLDVLDWTAGSANYWRTTLDIHEKWASAPGALGGSILSNYDANKTLGAYGGPGQFNDADMIPLDSTILSDAQLRAQLSLWIGMASPLMVTARMADVSELRLSWMRNAAALAVHQDALVRPGKVVSVQAAGDVEVLARPLSDGSIAVVVLNRGANPLTATLDAIAGGLPVATTSVKVTNVWTGSTVTGAPVRRVSLAPTSAELYRISVV